jgi:hypothetical protein
MRDMRMKPNKLIKDEKGQIFILVIILMLVASLLITPLLTYMYSGRIATLRNEVRMDELYAADAGIEYGIQRIKVKDNLPTSGNSTPYPPPEASINGKMLSPVKITCVDNATYRIEATANTTSPTTSNTTITAQVNIFYFPMFADKAITSPTQVTLKGTDTINGDIWTPSLDPGGGSGATINGTVDNSPVVGWPDEAAMIQAMRDFYLGKVPSTPVPSQTINLNNNDSITIGPLYVNGNLRINGPTGSGKSANVTLQGVVYVTGQLYLNNNLTVNFGNSDNSWTIYVQGAGYPHVDNPTPSTSSVFVPSTVTFSGIGCLISEQDIYFHPNQTSGGFIYVMSINGSINFQPGGTFSGSLAGKVDVSQWSGGTLTNPYSPEEIRNLGLCYPGSLDSENVVRRIVFWDIKLDK